MPNQINLLDDGTAIVHLTQGKTALIDQCDIGLVGARKWYAHNNRGSWYVKSSCGDRKLFLHRELLPGSIEVDHINGNGLDNRRCNIRAATHSQNLKNLRLCKRNSSGFKGVSWHAKTGKWRARIFVNGREFALGLFVDKCAAAAAYDTAALSMHGDFARANQDGI